MNSTYRVICGDSRTALSRLLPKSIQCAITSPPYWGLRDYGTTEQIGLEESPEQFVAELVAVFREVRRVLKDDGTLWVNLGDSYARAPEKGGSGTPNGRNVAKMGYTGAKPLPPNLAPKNLVGIPWRVAFALQADGWILRSDIIWHKPNPMPESVQDRPTKAHEYLFLLAKSERYFYDADAAREEIQSDRAPSRKAKASGAGRDGVRNSGPAYDGTGDTRNCRTVWTVPTHPYSGAHFATFPEDLIRPCVLAGSRTGDTVLDPFNGAATTGVVALKNGRNYVGCELNPEYVELSRRRLREVNPLFATEAA